MTTKKRKSLDDALAREFVYGEATRETSPTQATTNLEEDSGQNERVTQAEIQLNTEPAPVTKPASTPKSTKSNLMSQLQSTTPKEPTIRLTVDLPESMHRKLSVLAAKTGRKKVEIVRFLLDEALKDVED